MLVHYNSKVFGISVVVLDSEWSWNCLEFHCLRKMLHNFKGGWEFSISECWRSEFKGCDVKDLILSSEKCLALWELREVGSVSYEMGTSLFRAPDLG